MAADFNFEVTREAILDFLKERGGRAKNTDLIEHFKAAFPVETAKKAAARSTFKNYVDSVAFVKAESGDKYVCLRKKFRGSFKERDNTGTEPARDLSQGKLTCRYPAAPEPAVGANDTEPPAATGGEVRRQIPPGSGCGSDSQVRVPHVFAPVAAFPDKTDDESKCHDFVSVAEEVDSGSGEMGNRQSFRREARESEKERVQKEPDIPEIAVIEASPLPAAGSAFALPGPAQTGATGRVYTREGRRVGTESPPQEGLKEAGRINAVTRRQNSKGSQHRSRRPQSDGGGEDEGRADARSLCGSDGNVSPKGSRVHFIEVMMNSSPQLRRSMVLRNSVCLSPRGDFDSISLVSSNPDEDRGPAVTLDPLEHEWMMCSSDGDWASLRRLLTAEPGLVLRKDFVTGFTCLHWAAKHGKPELLALVINFAKEHDVPISVDVRSSTGYTPLHVAAMQNRMEVVKLLVGAYNADVEIRDYSGRKACQYLTDNVSVDIRDIIGAHEHSENAGRRDGGRSRLSKVLQANLRPLGPLSPDDCDSADGEVRPREKPVRRKSSSSFSRMRPKLERLRWRTSQIVHSASFRNAEELEGSRKGSFKSRPKTHFFG